MQFHGCQSSNLIKFHATIVWIVWSYQSFPSQLHAVFTPEFSLTSTLVVSVCYVKYQSFPYSLAATREGSGGNALPI